MPRFFTEHFADQTAWVKGEDAFHMAKVLRMSVGEAVTLCDQNGTDYQCVISEITPQQVACTILNTQPSATEPDIDVSLYMAIPKADKLEFIVQKAVELGVRRIVPVLCKRCVSRPDTKSMEKKRQRLQRIALEAAKQSGRGRVPTVEAMQTFDQAIREMCLHDRAVMLYENASEPFANTFAVAFASLALLIGPEGGFAPEEVAAAQEMGIAALSLGRRILRCETAPLAVLAVVMDRTGNL